MDEPTRDAEASYLALTPLDAVWLWHRAHEHRLWIRPWTLGVYVAMRNEGDTPLGFGALPHLAVQSFLDKLNLPETHWEHRPSIAVKSTWTQPTTTTISRTSAPSTLSLDDLGL